MVLVLIELDSSNVNLRQLHNLILNYCTSSAGTSTRPTTRIHNTYSWVQYSASTVKSLASFACPSSSPPRKQNTSGGCTLIGQFKFAARNGIVQEGGQRINVCPQSQCLAGYLSLLYSVVVPCVYFMCPEFSIAIHLLTINCDTVQRKLSSDQQWTGAATSMQQRRVSQWVRQRHF